MRRPSLGRATSKLNAEKIVLVAASAWFLATGAGLLRGPDLPEWGPPRTFTRAGDVPSIDIDNVPPFPNGGRDPFLDLEEEEDRPGAGPGGGVATPVSSSAGGAAGGGGGRVTGRGRTGKGEGEGRTLLGGRKPALPPVVPPRFVGTLSVEDSGTYTVVAEGEEYVAIAPGCGGAGRYRLVSRTATCIVLEDSSGRLHRVPVP